MGGELVEGMAEVEEPQKRAAMEVEDEGWVAEKKAGVVAQKNKALSEPLD